jgi:hypothetical protein
VCRHAQDRFFRLAVQPRRLAAAGDMHRGLAAIGDAV